MSRFVRRNHLDGGDPRDLIDAASAHIRTAEDWVLGADGQQATDPATYWATIAESHVYAQLAIAKAAIARAELERLRYESELDR